jgi:hypothetical protein
MAIAPWLRKDGSALSAPKTSMKRNPTISGRRGLQQG